MHYGYQMLTDLLDIWHSSGKKYSRGKGDSLIFNFNFVQNYGIWKMKKGIFSHFEQEFQIKSVKNCQQSKHLKKLDN